MNKWIKNTIFIAAIILVVWLLEWKGFIGLIIMILGFTAYRFWKHRENFMIALRGAESVIWKKPLDRDLWEKGEMKNTKVKMTWRKKNEKK